MKFNIRQISFYCTLGLIVLSSLSMFVERYISNFEKIVLLLSFFIGLFVFVFNTLRSTQINKKYLFVILPIFVSTFVYSLLIGKTANYLLQIVIILSSILPLFLIKDIEDSQLRTIAKTIFILAFVQIFFDLVFPNPDYSELDQYTGTFNSGNDKARFLIFVLLSFYFVGKNVLRIKPFGSFFRLLYSLPIVVSVILGFSLFAYLTFFISLASAFVFKKLSVFIIANIIVFVIAIQVIYGVNFDTKTPGQLTYNYHRYFDLEHGVAAVYKYGAQILSNNGYVFGVGLGNWVSRSAQLFKSEYLEENPSTMISFGTLYTDTAAPPGLSALFIQVVELGLISIPLILVFLDFLFKEKSTLFYGLISFYFIFFFINYSPLFFEFQSLSYLFLSSYLIFNKLIKIDDTSLL